MATLTDDEFLHEVDALVAGRENQLVATPPPVADPPPPPVVEAVVTDPPVDPPAPVDPPVETPPVDPVVVTDPPAAVVVDPAAAVVVDPPPVDPDYKGIYQRLFGVPIRAGGQDITIQSADEAISLIQKGVGFHNKLNKLQGQLKFVEMLRNNDLLDESRLSLLIDAHKKSPGAIKKLLDESKIDPLTLDSTEASTYAPTDHRVTDEQVRFQSTVADLTDTAHGTAILQDARGWDQASKSEIYKAPEMLGFLAHQKEIGRYDLIKAQVERQKMLGNIPATESFLTAYTRVGQQMMQTGAFGKPTPTTPATPTPVAQKVITPAPPANAQQAAAAAPTRSTTTPVAKAVPDTKQMSDADFEVFFKKTYSI